MAGNTGAEKYIGKLMLDISEVQKQINEVNTWLGKIGANINLEDKLSQKVSAALQKLVNEAKQAGEEASKALAEGASKSKFDTIYEKMEQKMLAFENKMQAEAEKAIAKADQRAEREAAAIERAEERKRHAREKQEQRYQQVWDKAARDREAQDAKEAANIDKQIAKYEAQDAKRAASAEKAAEREEQARAKKEAAYNDMWHRAEQQREQELAAEEAKLEQEVAKAEEVAQRKAQIEEEAAAKAAAARAKQEADYQLVWDKASYEQRQAAIRQYQQDIENYSKALAAYFTEIDNLQKQLVSRNVTEGSERYKAFTDNIARLKEEAQQAGASLDQAGKQTAASMQNVQTAVANLSKSSASIRDSKTPDYLKQVTAAYNTLRDAINNYNIAKKANNTSDMQTWQAEIDKQMGVISGVEQIVGSLNIEENVREQIVLKLQEAKTLQDGFTKGVVGGTTAASELESQMTGLLTRMFSIMAVIRSISSLIQNTVEYVSEYSDKMNEIQMITLKTDAEVAELADTYRDLAEMMNVSSLDMADAAIYFTRQGLGAAEIEKRLRNVTMYAKAANVEFEDASEIITAVVNSMGLAEQEMKDGRNAAQRVADVFLKVGDSAATSGQEIGEAMQKAAASAGAFGMSFEWLASYIATVSETTRQEARTIGTALNTIIARLHQIKQQGYNSEDETKINDVQKALAKIGVTLMDNNNEWRDMDTIFQEIGAQWDTLDGKTKSYIATTMAGVKQQNVFLALMNDLGKGVEGGSRAWELYEKAVDSAGTAEKKYAVYKDSVAASQERLNIAQEKFYSLMDSSVIKNWNDMWAGYVNSVTKGAEVTHGLNLILPVAIGLFTAFAIAIQKAGTASAFFASVWETHPILIAIGAAAMVVATLVTLISNMTAAIETQDERLAKANETLNESNQKLQDYILLQAKANDMFAELGDENSNKTLKDYNELLDELSGLSLTARDAVDKFKAGLSDETEVAEILNAELEKYIAHQREISTLSLISQIENTPKDARLEVAKEMSRQGINDDKGKFGWFLSDLLYGELSDNKYNNLNHDVMNDELYQIIAKYEEMFDTIEDENERWYQIGRSVWIDYFEGAESASDYITSKVNQFIDDSLSKATVGMDSSLKGLLKDKLVNMVFGTDGILNEQEAANYSNVVHDFLKAWYMNGLEFTDEEIDEYREKLFEQIAYKSGEHLNDNGDMMLWEDLDLDTVQLVSDLVDAGTALSEIKAIMKDSSSVDEFKEKLESIGKEAKDDLDEGEEEAEEFTVKLKKITQEIDKLNKMISTLESGKTVDFEDLLNLADAHPEIMAAIHDTESLLAALKKLRQEDNTKAIATMRNNMLNSTGFAAQSGFAVKEGQTLREFMDETASRGRPVDFVNDYINQIIATFLASTDKLDAVGKDVLGEWMTSMFSNSNVDLLKRKAVQIGDDIATVLTETITASADGQHGIKWNQDVVVNITPITPDGEKLDEEEFYKYVDELFAKSKDMDELFANDAVANGGKGLLIQAFPVEGEWQEAIKNATDYAELLHLLQEAYYGVADAEKTWLQTQMEQAELTEQLNWAKSNGYIEQINQLRDYLGDESIDGANAALELWNSYDESMRKSIAETYPGIMKAMAEIESAMKDTTDEGMRLDNAAKGLGKSLGKAATTATAQNFTKTYAAVQKLEKGTISAAEAFDTFYSETDKITKAQEEINTATDKMADGVELAVSDVNDLAGVLGISADQILQDFPGAVDMFNQLIGRTGDLQAAFDALNEAAFIRITGVADVDFSALTNGLKVVGENAEEVIKLLEATGQWKLERKKLDGEMPVLNGNKITLESVQGFQDILVPTGNNPYKGTSKSNYSGSNSSKKSGGGGGGGNKNNNSNQMTEVELMLNRMEQMQAIIESQQGFYSAQSNYYKQTGHLQGVIGYSQKEIQVLEAQNDVLKQNIEQIDKYRQQKEAELEALDVSDEKYEEVRDDLDKLQKTHQQYTKQVVENETAIDQLNETIKETQKQIRDMQIKIREQIYKAVEDREKKAKNMLQNEITMENTILDIIKRKYEIERDKIIENTDARITALQEEKDLLSEQLRIRKEMAEEEDKAAKLAQLEANYNRIVADPTRAKEAKKIQDEINALRKEMAWDAAEKEVEAQQDSIDQQITSLEDYKQYIEEYYEDLFAHPAKLIEEMRNIITRTDDEILDWLKQNSEEYAASSENTQHQMVNTWSDTLDEMRGRIKTYWDGVEEIIAGGDDKIIQFLIDNSEDYAKAGKLQAEKYVDEWREELEDLHKALEAAFTIDAPNYVVMDPSTGNSGSSSSGGGGGSGSGGGKTDHGYSFTYGGKTYSKNGFKTQDEANSAMKERVKKEVGGTAGTSSSYVGQAIRAIQNSATVYAKGGIADFTGPAWLDGTKQDPERILSPYQTKLFETMVQALEKMSTISIPSMPNLGNIDMTGSGGVNVGDIIVNVDNLDTDDDYEELADKVSEVLMERIGRTAVVGGLRINPI